MILLKNGTLISNNEAQIVDILINDHKIEKIAANIEAPNAKVIELDKKLIAPGFVDVHVHLREPGYTHKETIESGSKAAARGGFTTIAAMPNTIPAPDCEENIELIQSIIKKDAKVRVIPYATITKNQRGQELVDFKALKKYGIIGFSDDGHGVQTTQTMFEAMQQAAALDMPIVAHCEEDSLLYGGYIHDGEYAKAHGHRGISTVSESVQIARDIMLAKAAGVHYHVCHISTKDSVELIRFAKAQGINVTCEVAPHHLILSDSDIVDDNTNFKMNPPLRGREDVKACIEGLLDGTIDCIATDHAPHTEEEKARGLEIAPFGIVGLETAFPLMYTNFVKTNQMSIGELIACMSTKPAAVFNLPYGKIEVGEVADLVVIDLEKEMTIDKNTFESMGMNTPFHGVKASGWPVMTMVEGRIVYEDKV